MSDTKKVRVWVDGCFDMLHFGHANALRQAKELGDELIVGIHCDEEIKFNKGLPVFNEEERYRMLRSIKWVDEIVEGAPYVTHVQTLNEFNCDFCAHGDDITTTADGVDSYHEVKAANKMKEFKRTQGISTTDLVDRILNMNEHTSDPEDQDLDSPRVISRYTKGAGFLATSLRIAQFQQHLKEPTPDDIVVYAPGCYDLFHVGHCMFLEKCSRLGTYVIVGLYADETAKAIYGDGFPVITLYERLLSILSCKYVSNVVVCPPYKMTEDMMDVLKIDLVVHGNTKGEKLDKVFEVPRRMDKFQTVDSGSNLTLEMLIERIKKNREEYESRNKKKEQKERTQNGPLPSQ